MLSGEGILPLVSIFLISIKHSVIYSTTVVDVRFNLALKLYSFL